MERRPLGEGAFALVSPVLAEIGVLAAFTERTGGGSAGRFESLNLSYSSGDDPATVGANRRKVVNALGIPPFALGGQVHGNRIAAVSPARAGAGFEGPDGVIPKTDGLTTTAEGVALAVATADCVPVVLASEGEPRVTVVHAGWRGVAAGIVDRALAAFRDPRNVRAAVGPAAGGCHYEVGKDVARSVTAGTPAGAVTSQREGRLYLDLAATIAVALREAGVARVEVAGLCTIHEAKRFFSHRRDGPCGRQLAIAVRMR